MTNLVEITNAIIAAVLPHFTDVARKLDLPVETPILREDLAHAVAGIDPIRADAIRAYCVLKSGARFWFSSGHVDSFELPSSYFALQNPDDIPKFYGTPRLSQAECEQIARKSLDRLGYTNLLADTPLKEVRKGYQGGGHAVPRCKFIWQDGLDECYLTFKVEVDSEHGSLHSMFLSGSAVARPAPKLSVPLPPRLRETRPEALVPEGAVERSFAHRDALVRLIWPEILEWFKNLGLPLPRGGPDQEVDFEKTKCFLLRGRLGCHLTTRAGQCFAYYVGHVFYYSAPDAYFNHRYLNCTKLEFDDFLAEFKYSHKELAEIGRSVLKEKFKLDPATFHLDLDAIPFALDLQIKGRRHLRRYLLDYGPPMTEEEFMRQTRGIFRPRNTRIEFDTVTAEIKTLQISHAKLPPKPDPDLGINEGPQPEKSGTKP